MRTILSRAWDMPLPDPVKLIEVGQVTDNRRSSFLMLVGGADVSDYKRRLLVTHWTGGQFAVDSVTEFAGTAVDALLVGRFRKDPAPAQATVTPPAPTEVAKPGKHPKPAPKKKPAAAVASQQVITTEGVYSWRGSSLYRHFTAPPSARLAVILDPPPDLVVGGQGANALAYVMGDTQADPYPGNPPNAGEGYVRWGVGTQEYEGWEELKMPLGLRFAQSYWSGRDHWIIAIERPPNTPSGPSQADRLVLLTPRAGKTDIDFWAAKPGDMEESWRSEPFPGRILDVRVGDPRNEGKEGIVVLTSERNDKERHLYCYRASTIAAGL